MEIAIQVKEVALHEEIPCPFPGGESGVGGGGSSDLKVAPPVESSPLRMKLRPISARSHSLSRTDLHPEVQCGSVPEQQPPVVASGKLTRSKSSVEKKIHHEMAMFWRKTRDVNNKLFKSKDDEVFFSSFLLFFYQPKSSILVVV